MTDIDRYITEAMGDFIYDRRYSKDAFLRHVLPGILAQHRADVLREAAAAIRVYGDSRRVRAERESGPDARWHLGAAEGAYDAEAIMQRPPKVTTS